MNEPAATQSQRTAKVIAMPRPDSVADLGIRKSFLEDLALKILYLTGPLPILELADRLRLSYRATDELFRRLREGLLCEVSSISQNVPLLTITGQGRARALELLSLNQYTGPAPVSLPSYVQQVKMQSVRNVAIHPPDIQRAFSHLVIDSKILAQLGTALNSGTSIFLHGPTGSGKTTIAENLTSVLALDKVWIPHAVEIDGEDDVQVGEREGANATRGHQQLGVSMQVPQHAHNQAVAGCGFARCSSGGFTSRKRK